MTSLEHASSVASIDFADWHDTHGITCLLFDIEGTLTEWADPAVSEEIVKHLARARRHGITHIGLVTNINKAHEARVQDVARQIGADVYRFPTKFIERKPGSRMIKSILQELSVTPSECGFVGDKYVDVLAARSARLRRVAWVERYGKADHWFDRVVYRRVERHIKS